MIADFSRPILAIDTSTSTLSLALQHADTIHTFHQEVGNRQSALILPEIQKLFAATQINTSQLGTIVYAQGPGAFTGLRIGLGVAQGLATPFNTPLIGIPCLDAVAHQLSNQPLVLAATDARMGEVFYAWFNTENHQRLSDYQVNQANQIKLPENSNKHSIYCVGNAFTENNLSLFSEKIAPANSSVQMPTAVDYLLLAKSKLYPTHSAAEATLLYVRDKVALTAKEQAQRLQNKQ